MNLCTDLEKLALNPHTGAPLLDVAFKIALDEYPNLDIDSYKSEIKMLTRDCLLPNGKGLELKLKAFTRHFCHILGFQGNSKDYYDPANSFLNQVIDRRLGIPITLGVLAMAMGEQMGLRIFGIGLPGHFINQACEGDQAIFFDVFHGGKILQPEDFELLGQDATGSKIIPVQQFLQPMSNAQIIIRMLTNLRLIYASQGDLPRSIRTLERLSQILPGEASFQKELGFKLIKANQPARALKHLAKYQIMVPPAVEDEEFREALHQARREESLRN